MTGAGCGAAPPLSGGWREHKRAFFCVFLHLIATFVLFFAFLHSLCFALHFYLCLYYFSFVYFLCYYICCTLYVLFFCVKFLECLMLMPFGFGGGQGVPITPPPLGLRWLVGSDPPPKMFGGGVQPPLAGFEKNKNFLLVQTAKNCPFPHS